MKSVIHWLKQAMHELGAYAKYRQCCHDFDSLSWQVRLMILELEQDPDTLWRSGWFHQQPPSREDEG